MKSLFICLILTMVVCDWALAKTDENVRLAPAEVVRLKSLQSDLLELRASDGRLSDRSSTPFSEQAQAARAFFKKARIDVSTLSDSEVVSAAKDKRVQVACNDTFDITVQSQPLNGGKAMTLTRRQVPTGKVDEVVSFLTDSMSLACGIGAPVPTATITRSSGAR